MLDVPGPPRQPSSTRRAQARDDEVGLAEIRSASDPPRDPDPVEENTHDLDLIRSSLARTPDERLAVLQDFVDTFWQPRHG